jgi:hypothetical protein
MIVDLIRANIVELMFIINIYTLYRVIKLG